MKCVDDRGEHKIWYPWGWCQERGRWERECAMMGCLAWQHAAGARIAGRVVTQKAGLAHEHVWGVWYAIDELHAKDNLHYERHCACGAEEQAEDLLADGPFEFFEHPRDKR